MKPWKRLMILELAQSGKSLAGHCGYADVRRLGQLLEPTDDPGRYTLTTEGEKELARLRSALAITDEVQAICKGVAS